VAAGAPGDVGRRADGAPTDLARFSRAVRALHWATGVAVLVCALTGLVLYVGPLTAWVGRRALVRDVHVVSGVLMPVPLVLAYAGPWRSSVRSEVRRLARWSPADRRWLWSRGRDARDQVGKYNAGQKANAAFVAGMIPVMLATGAIMRWYDPLGVEIAQRTGATFVHDWTAVATWFVVAGHIGFALADRVALRGMVTGRVSRRWAERHHPRWAAELPPPARPATAAGPAPSAPPVPPTAGTPRDRGAGVGDGADRPLR
jgi:formate dehydrogenase subunit gamma